MSSGVGERPMRARQLRVMHAPWTGKGTTNPYVRMWVGGCRSANVDIIPYSTRRLLREQVDVVHLNWPDGAVNRRSTTVALLRTIKVLLRPALAHLCGASVVWTAHNLSSHEQYHPWIEALLWRRFLPQVDAIVSLTAAAEGQIRSMHPSLSTVPISVIPHGNYSSELGPGPNDEPVYDLGMVGAVRRYKRHDEVVRVLREEPGIVGRVLIAGSAADPELGEELTAFARERPLTELRLGHLSDLEFEAAVRSCRIIVLAQTSALNSGAMLYALSCGRPVLAADLPTFREIRELVGDSWVLLFEPPLDAQELRNAVESAQRLSGEPDLSMLDWDRLGSIAADLYRAAAEGRSSWYRGFIDRLRNVRKNATRVGEADATPTGQTDT